MGVTLLGVDRAPLRTAMADVSRMIAAVRASPQTAVLLVLSMPGWKTSTLDNLHRAERAGLKRPIVLRAIERKFAELGGQEKYTKPRLAFGAKALEPGEAAWEKNHPTLKR